jgi:hypothetical protein
MWRAVRSNFRHAVKECEAIEFNGPRISPANLPRQRPDLGNLFSHSRMTPKLRCGGNSPLSGTNATASLCTGSFSFNINHLTSRRKRGQKQIGRSRRLGNADQ